MGFDSTSFTQKVFFNSAFFTFLFFFYIIIVTAQNTTLCNRGTFRSSNGTCIDCPPGTYSNQSNLSKCFPCPPGSFFPSTGAQTRRSCRSCPDDSFSKSGSSSCTLCQPGFVGIGTDKCIRCAPGTYLIRRFDGDTRIRNAQCEICSVSSYTDGFNMGECKRCPIGSIAKEGSTSKNDCKKCPPGSSDGGDACVPCPKSTFFDGITPNPEGTTVNNCYPCQAGFRSKPGSAKCEPCKPGEYGLRFGRYQNPECKNCPSGTNTFGKAATFCRAFGEPCPADHFEDKLGDCRKCNNRERFDPDSLKCIPCPKDYRTKGGKDQTCVNCADIINTELYFENTCAILGSYNAVPKVNGKCPPGSGISDFYPNFCIKCSIDQFSNATDTAECKKCPPNTSTFRKEGATNCQPCPEGLVLSSSEYSPVCVVPQTGCVPGEILFSGPDGYEQCERTDCPNPRPKDGRSFGKCVNCNYGKCPECAFDEVSPDGLVCQKCPNGTVRMYGLQSDSCVCNGEYAVYRGIIKGACQKCPLGQAGKYNRELKENICEKCPSGTFYRTEPEGTIGFCLGMGCIPEKVCTPCKKGFFTSKPGSLICIPCPKGTTTGGPGESECKPIISSSQT